MDLVGFASYTLLCFWIVFLDGAERLEGWGAFFMFNWFAASLTPQELRFYVAISWIAALAALLLLRLGGA